MLHLSAMSGIQFYTKFKGYYERKIREGKPETIVINAIRSEIVLRTAAVINK